MKDPNKNLKKHLADQKHLMADFNVIQRDFYRLKEKLDDFMNHPSADDLLNNL